ncbi:prolyl oligopeptidase family serine peptidase [Paraburkholderia sp. EG287B]|uniref:S9 family peptidase n=1 Tax=Paraburkholderia sp. EG287B TaxID=3237010 RepID=UPI0034D36E00
MERQATTIDLARYERAARFLPPNFVLQLSGTLIDGYWLDKHRYFFCVAEAGADGEIVNRPKLIDARTHTITPVIAFNDLAELLSSQSGKQIDASALAKARYDMPEAGRLVVKSGSDAYHVSLEGPTLMRAEELDAVPALHSPDGRLAAFLKENAVWIKSRETGAARQLTPNGERYYAFGAWVESGLSPLKLRKNPVPDGLWSADSEWFVTHRIDERSLPESGLVQNVPGEGKRPKVHTFKVSSPDADLAEAEFVAYHLPSGRSISSASHPVQVGIMPPFLYKQCWFADASIYFLDWDRFSSEVSLVQMPLDGGPLRTVLTEKAEAGWIDLNPRHNAHPMIRPLLASNELIWYSEADGYAHLYLHDLATGARKGRITEGKWMVREIVHVDATARRILFLASGFEGQRDPAYRRLCAINFDGGGFETLLAPDADIFAVEGAIATDADSGTDLAQFNPFRPSYAASGASADATFIVLGTAATDSATRILLFDVTSSRSTELARSNVDSIWDAPKPQPFEVLAADGVTKLHGAMYLPGDFDPSKSYPLVDCIYPGPHVNWYIRRFPSWPALDLQALAELGMVGIVLETRGMPWRNRAFHQAGQGRMLEPQLSDHMAAIEQLCERHSFLDRNRVGMFGQSGGGYATARAMFDYPKTIKVGVSVCGNHDNRNYMAHWIDKYGPRPESPERESQCNVDVAHKLEGKLFLIHGEMDENVHPAHTLAVCDALIAAGKDFDQLIVPNAGHMLMLEKPYVFQRVANYLVRHLVGAEPPPGFKLQWTDEGVAAAMGMAMSSFA